jgi:hypothetical protein
LGGGQFLLQGSSISSRCFECLKLLLQLLYMIGSSCAAFRCLSRKLKLLLKVFCLLMCL